MSFLLAHRFGGAVCKFPFMGINKTYNGVMTTPSLRIINNRRTYAQITKLPPESIEERAHGGDSRASGLETNQFGDNLRSQSEGSRIEGNEGKKEAGKKQIEWNPDLGDEFLENAKYPGCTNPRCDGSMHPYEALPPNPVVIAICRLTCVCKRKQFFMPLLEKHFENAKRLENKKYIEILGTMVKDAKYFDIFRDKKNYWQLDDYYIKCSKALTGWEQTLAVAEGCHARIKELKKHIDVQPLLDLYNECTWAPLLTQLRELEKDVRLQIEAREREAALLSGKSLDKKEEVKEYVPESKYGFRRVY